MVSRVKRRGTRRGGSEGGRQAGRLGRVLARRLANGKLLGPQSPVTLEKSDFSCAKTGWLGWAGWLADDGVGS